MSIGFFYVFFSSETCNKHQESRLGQMEVGDDAINKTPLVPWIDKYARLLLSTMNYSVTISKTLKRSYTCRTYGYYPLSLFFVLT